MKIYIISTISEYGNELAELTRTFFPEKEVSIVKEIPCNKDQGDILINCSHRLAQKELELKIEYIKYQNEPLVLLEKYGIPNHKESDYLALRRWAKNRIKLSLYDFLSDLTGKNLDWGALTGVSPTKLAHDLLDIGYEDDNIIRKLYEGFRITSKKAKLLLSVAKVQRPYFKDNHPNKISLYINIPLCVSKCLFCSFPSAIIGECSHLLDDYIWALNREMEAMAYIARKENIEVDALYIGGGTPTSLGKAHLERLFDSICNHWGSNPWKEYSLEGGRPDTMDEDKLRLVKNYGITRISINPQTMKNKSLKAIGRGHSAEEIRHSYDMARNLGFDNINMDVIVGLPGEGIVDSVNTMNEIVKMGPDNVTVHTLAIKRASRLKDRLKDYNFIDESTADKMMGIFHKGAQTMGMKPYYLYRQKYMLGNMENVGFSVAGKESIYNMQMMENRQSIWAFGAGAITKICYPQGNRIERAPNVKNLEDYIARIDEMIERKRRRIYDN